MFWGIFGEGDEVAVGCWMTGTARGAEAELVGPYGRRFGVHMDRGSREAARAMDESARRRVDTFTRPLRGPVHDALGLGDDLLQAVNAADALRVDPGDVLRPG